jgi:hypothetical protein
MSGFESGCSRFSFVRAQRRKRECSGLVTSPLPAGRMRRGLIPLFPRSAIQLFLTPTRSRLRLLPGCAQYKGTSILWR